MRFLLFIKDIILEGRNSLLAYRQGQQSLPKRMRAEVDRKIASTNVKRLIPFASLLLLIEIINLVTLFVSRAYPDRRAIYLTVGLALVALTVATIYLSYRTLNAASVDVRRCKRLTRAFWFFFSLNMLGFIYLEISSRGLTNNFFYLLILTAAFPLLGSAEALCLFGMDLAATLPIAVCYGFTVQQLIQLPLVALFALILSRILYNTHRVNEIMVEKLELSNKKLAALAQTDPLTGLLNRRGIQERLQERLRAMEPGLPVASLMVDIDLFKTYNDHFGHDVGDVCLQKVAGVLERCVRSPDELASRIGGEEFLLVLTACDAACALLRAQQLRREVEALALPSATDAVAPYVTVSVGVALCAAPLDFSELYGLADRALYQAKEAGRNCVVLNGRIYRETQ